MSIYVFESVAYYFSPVDYIAILKLMCLPVLYFLALIYPLIMMFYTKWLDQRAYNAPQKQFRKTIDHRRTSSTGTTCTINPNATQKLFILKPKQLVLDQNSKRSDLRELLNKILATPALLELFSDFLAREYCVETLIFIQAIEQYRKIARMGNIGLLKVQRNRIVEEFLMANAINEMNLPFKMKVDICKKVQELSTSDKLHIDLFDTLDSHIKDSLIDNKIARFANSEAFQKHIF
ncbi:hypothetical protein HK103_005986 [Boothiomyces macroporosus]|uniref:RGS domain-containing protein n=1 Tax=Boothiomyces macroporosus TaxID=261099 RepID=A0AAD5UQ43_9FUNG|nr:hypothetical protein HK103_005986 [Boothiomyces macroporosus]